MSHIILPKGWNSPQREITPETVYQNRREFLQLMGFAVGGIAGALLPESAMANTGSFGLFDNEPSRLKTDFPPVPNLKRNLDYPVSRPISSEVAALKYNNFYEFTSEKNKVWENVDAFETRPWQVKVSGLVKNPLLLDVDELIKMMPIEERVYRHRCVETWAMVVPWNGFAFSGLMAKVEPEASAKYVEFTSFYDPAVAQGQDSVVDLPWPYREALTIEEAENELTFLSTGIYGHQQPAQHGAPIRLVTPWKYGFKSIKSIVEIKFTDSRPATFWNTLIPNEYDFTANVDPLVAHPRWSQKREKMIGSGDVYATQKFNGYGEFVSHLYL
ncbi:MAG: protein-methionine-sulfoxide reductase catalytic subunit MsrP [Nitrospinae bacterium CG11_big_fil_rev_8_21_14_0_20_45_15]|nr:MAG: protein-methionine-sulfoxide reductase catalytic subunit MsrP [Nitrospinae bacterium CG11_big_fil_rev_8_21_14_0_20_45_15]